MGEASPQIGPQELKHKFRVDFFYSRLQKQQLFTGLGSKLNLTTVVFQCHVGRVGNVGEDNPFLNTN